MAYQFTPSPPSRAPNLHDHPIPFGIHRAACRGVLLRVADRSSATSSSRWPRPRNLPSTLPTPSLMRALYSRAQPEMRSDIPTADDIVACN